MQIIKCLRVYGQTYFCSTSILKYTKLSCPVELCRNIMCVWLLSLTCAAVVMTFDVQHQKMCNKMCNIKRLQVWQPWLCTLQYMKWPTCGKQNCASNIMKAVSKWIVCFHEKAFFTQWGTSCAKYPLQWFKGARHCKYKELSEVFSLSMPRLFWFSCFFSWISHKFSDAPGNKMPFSAIIFKHLWNH